MKKDRRKIRLALFIVFGVLVSLVAPFLIGGNSGTSSEQVVQIPTSTEIGPVLSEEENAASTTSLPFTVETEPPNKAPQISIQGPSCFIYNTDTPESFNVTLVVEDPDEDLVTLDLSYSIGERTIDLTNEIDISENLRTPLKKEVSINLEAGIEEKWILLLSHATDPEGSKSEAASIVTLSDTQC